MQVNAGLSKWRVLAMARAPSFSARSMSPVRA